MPKLYSPDDNDNLDFNEYKLVKYLESLSLSELTSYIKKCNKWQSIALTISTIKIKEFKIKRMKIKKIGNEGDRL